MKKGHHKKHSKLTWKNILVLSLCVIVPAILGIISGDLLVGGALVATSFLGSYLSILQKRTAYFFGFTNAFLIAFVGLKNGFFGSFFINVFIFAPLDVMGFLAWSRNLDRRKNVKIRKFNLQKGIFVTLICLIGSVLFGYLLTKIPTQQMAFLDSTICCIDICALVIMNLRYKESWWLWTISGALSVAMWIIALTEGGDNAFMRLVAAIGLFLINAYGAINWHRKLK